MIAKLEIYKVSCDLCEEYYISPKLQFPGKEEVLTLLQEKGWIIMHNQDDFCPQVLCPDCKDEANFYMQQNQKHEMVPEDCSKGY